MRFLIDECLHESLAGVAHAAGFEATHANRLGLSGQPDWALAARIAKEEFTFVTNNRVDFVRLFGKMEVHAGLMVLVPNLAPGLQRALFHAALQFTREMDLVNTIIEVDLANQTVTCTVWNLPAK